MPDSDVDLNALAKERGYTPLAQGDPEKSPPVSAASILHGINQSTLDVERGVDKSIAGTAVAIPRLANLGISYIPKYGEGWSRSLGSLAEQIPGVTQMERFADSPNQSMSENVGYGAGEVGQFFGDLPLKALAWAGRLGKGAKVAEGAADVGKAAEATEAPFEFNFNEAREAAQPQRALPPSETKALAAPYHEPPGPDPFVNAERAQGAARTSAYNEEQQAQRAEAAARQAREPPKPSFEHMPPPEPPPPPKPKAKLEPQETKSAYKQRLKPTMRRLAAVDQGMTGGQIAGRIAGGAAKGGLVGAATDPQDPGMGALFGAGAGAAAPGLGWLAGSKFGQYALGFALRSTLASLASKFGGLANIPHAALWRSGVLPAMEFYHSPLGRIATDWGRTLGRRGGRALRRVPPRYPGAAAGWTANAGEDSYGDDEADAYGGR